ncbi:hypothetical protein T4B_1385 [Trichinella pseudospiralis]|uniref:Uncharacterized protein n=1 Tax=Trichinella pseudospiralis TaxID=6337 RepID=A0A0V1KDE0_TRIPS|nr:hypothetical protein T4B_1385 [Trichinella pseudospiralis]KRZ45229.1 hypothetical protein T4C_9028 [Trichinella pseudospiralis]
MRFLYIKMIRIKLLNSGENVLLIWVLLPWFKSGCNTRGLITQNIFITFKPNVFISYLYFKFVMNRCDVPNTTNSSTKNVAKHQLAVTHDKYKRAIPVPQTTKAQWISSAS